MRGKVTIERKMNISYLNGAVGGNVIGEVASVEVALEGTNGQDELRVFYLFLHFGSTDGANVDLIDISNQLLAS